MQPGKLTSSENRSEKNIYIYFYKKKEAQFPSEFEKYFKEIEINLEYFQSLDCIVYPSNTFIYETDLAYPSLHITFDKQN